MFRKICVIFVAIFVFCSCYTTTPQASTAKKTDTENTTSNVQKPERRRAVQCSGRTKKGTRCKRMTTDQSGRCYQHR